MLTYNPSRGIQSSIFILLLAGHALAWSSGSGSITGRIMDRERNQPLPGTNVIVVGTGFGAAAGPDGRFVISRLPAGTYTIEARIIGYAVERVADIIVEESRPADVNFIMIEQVLALSEVVVTPGHFSMMAKGITANQTLKLFRLESSIF